jgi:hypothetical protein
MHDVVAIVAEVVVDVDNWECNTIGTTLPNEAMSLLER